jgi:CHAD domain-containing protein
VLRDRLAEQVAELRTRAEEARAGDPEGVHHTRVASRRLRSALATFRSLVDREVTDPLRDELRWLGRSLSPARDTHVVHRRLADLLDRAPVDAATHQARARLDEEFAGLAEAAEAEAAAALDSGRYAALLADLDRLLADPPWRGRAERPAADVLPALVKRDWRRLQRSLEAVPEAADRDIAVHRVRKDAKRFRYAVETLVPLWGEDAARLVDAARQMTAHLGERQDVVTGLGHLRRLRATADAVGESSAAWGALRAVEERRLDDLDRELDQVWHQLSRKQLRSWLG